jgi:Fcf2 pre-rRNA processing
MRSYIHKNRFYKKATTKKLPAYFQVGTVVGGAADRYNRLTKRERQSNMVDELLHDSSFRQWTKRKYSETQRKAASGRNRSQQKKKKKKRFNNHRR